MSDCYFEIYVGAEAEPYHIFDLCTWLEGMYSEVNYYLDEGYLRVVPNNSEGEQQ